MAEIKVWAPKPKSLGITFEGRTLEMARDSRGHATFFDETLRAGTRYGFVVDSSSPLPDPRSRSQPDGVHGLSEYVEPVRVRTSAGPIPPGVIYEMHIGTFSPEGTFKSAIEHLDHIAELGADCVEIMPLAAFPGKRGWGYDGVDLFAVHRAYGSRSDLVDLVTAIHDREMSALIDVVYNHLGPSGNYLSKFGPYFTKRYSTPWGDAVNFDDAGSAEVRAFVIDNARMWLEEFGFDGLRIDAAQAIYDMSAVHILEELASSCRKTGAELGRPIFLSVESDLNNPRLVSDPALGGYGLDAHWNDDFHHVLHVLLTGERDGYYRDFGSVEQLERCLKNGYVNGGGYSEYRGRRHGRPYPAELGGSRLIAFLQNHDQVGNRARGDRLGMIAGGRAQKVGAAFLMTAPFIPLIFQGEEWAASSPFLYFTDHEEQELAEAVRRGRRREFASFGWRPEEVPDPQDESTFQKSKLDWDEIQTGEHADMLDWYKRLIALRRQSPSLTDGDLINVSAVSNESSQTLVLRRGPITVAGNFSSEEQTVDAEGTILLASDDGVSLGPTGLRLPGVSVAVMGID